MNGNIIKELRKDKNLTQNDLGKILGVTQKAITKYENNAAQMSYETIIKFCNFFNITTDYFFGRENDFGIIEQSNNALTENENQVIALYRKLNVHDQHKVLGFIQALAY